MRKERSRDNKSERKSRLEDGTGNQERWKSATVCLWSKGNRNTETRRGRLVCKQGSREGETKVRKAKSSLDR